MDSNEILKYCLAKGFLIDNELFKILNEVGDIDTVKALIDTLSNKGFERIITKSLFMQNKERVSEILSTLPNEKQKLTETLKIRLGLSIEISREMIKEPISINSNSRNVKEEIEEVSAVKNFKKSESTPQLNEIQSNVKVISTFNIQSKKLEVRDFVTHFRGRYSEMQKMLQERPELTNLVSIDKISGNRQGISIIGMVSNKRTTKNKNILLELEDLTGKINVIVNQNRPEVYSKADDVTLDSVIAIKCSGTREIAFANDIIFPDTSLQLRKKALVEEYALFTGDMHIGSDRFMEKNFLKFIDYINGKIPNSKDTHKIKYLFLIGDLIAGVGEYPGQERDLAIGDVEGQYEKAAELLGKIRSDIHIIIIPGNHDAVRLMEPQPTLDERYAWPLYEMKNITLATNPSVINIASSENFKGFDVLMYHGFSYHYYAEAISSLREIKASRRFPDKVMAYLLKNRHLAPTHTSSVYCPSEEDPLVIKQAPDVFFSGHTHKSGVSYYNNILVISSSSWETKTPYQEKLGNEPDYCKVPMFNLKTRAIKILDFE